MSGPAVRVGGEALGGEFGPVQVAEGHPGAGHVELADHAGRGGPQGLVQHVHPGAGQRAADRRLDRSGQRLADGGADRGLGRAVRVEHPPARGPALHQLGRAGLAGRDEGEAVGHRQPDRPGGEHRRRQADHLDAGLRDQLGERLAGCPVGLRGQHQDGAGEQRGEQLPGGGVEAERGELQQSGALADAEAVVLGGQRGHRPVRHQHALGAAGGAGGVDHVRRVVRAQRGDPLGVLRVVRGGSGDRGGGCRVVQQQHGCGLLLGQPSGHRAVAEHRQRGGVLEQVGDPLSRVRRVDGQVGRARLEDREHRDDRVDRARQRQGDDPSGARAQGDQVVGEPVGALVQLAVADLGAHRAVLEPAQRGPLGRAVRLRLEQRGQVDGTDGGRDRGPAPGAEQQLALLGQQGVQSAERPVGLAGEQADQVGQPVREAAGGPLGEQVGAVLQGAGEAVRLARPVVLFDEFEGQVELGRPGADRADLGGQAGQLGAGPGVVLEGQHHLEERLAGQRAAGAEPVDQLLEGHVLVGQGGQDGLPSPADQGAEGRVAGEVGAQHQGVDEEADQTVQGLGGAPGHRGAERDVRRACRAARRVPPAPP